VGVRRPQENLSEKEQVTDEETPTEEGLGLQMPKVPGLPENVDKVAISSSSSSSSSLCGQDDNVRMWKKLQLDNCKNCSEK